MKDKLDVLKKNYKEIITKRQEIFKRVPDASRKLEQLDTQGQFEKEETLKDAIHFYLDNTTREEKDLVASYGENHNEFFKLSRNMIESGQFDEKTIKKMIAYKDCGVVEIADRIEDLNLKIEETKMVNQEIKDEFKADPRVSLVVDKVNTSIDAAKSFIAPYIENPSKTMETLTTIGKNRVLDIKNELEEKTHTKVKSLKEKLNKYLNNKE